MKFENTKVQPLATFLILQETQKRMHYLFLE